MVKKIMIFFTSDTIVFQNIWLEINLDSNAI